MFSRNFIIYNADVTEREPSKFNNPAEHKSFSGLGARSLNEVIHLRIVKDLECEPRYTHIFFYLNNYGSESN